MRAPVTVICAGNKLFYDKLPGLFPHADAARGVAWFAGSAKTVRAEVRCRPDVGPMSDFDKTVVDAAFFEGTGWTADRPINLGHGDASVVLSRLPRLGFDAACVMACRPDLHRPAPS